MTKHKTTVQMLILTVCLMLGATACGTKATGTNQVNFSNDNSNNRSLTVSPTPLENSPKAEPPPLDSSKIPTVTYCELTKNAADYDHKIVRVRAIYFNEFERSYLYDSECKRDSPPAAPKEIPAETWAQWDESFVSKGDSAEAVLNRQINGFGRSDVTLIGKFDSTREKTDPSATNLFGHLACCRFQFLIMRVESVHSSNVKTADTANQFGTQIKFKVNQKLEFSDFTVECLKLLKSENTFKIKKGDKELIVSADDDTPTRFSFNKVNYLLELGVADKSGRIAKDELMVSKIGY